MNWKNLLKAYEDNIGTMEGYTVPDKINYEQLPVRDVKGIIVGQDPYAYTHNNKPLATPIPIAVTGDKIPLTLAALQKMYEHYAMKHNLPNKTLSKNLIELKQLGVIFLNAIPKVKLGHPNSRNIAFIINSKQYLPHHIAAGVINEVIKVNPNVAILALGREAEKAIKLSKAIKYTAVPHPGALKYNVKIKLSSFYTWMKKVLQQKK